MGVLNAPCTISVAKEAGQAAADAAINSGLKAIDRGLLPVFWLMAAPSAFTFYSAFVERARTDSRIVAMARQAEAERERRAKVINAEGEYQAAARLTEAATIIAREPAALQLRYLQTLAEIATENNSTTIFPVPIDLLKAFMGSMERKSTT